MDIKVSNELAKAIAATPDGPSYAARLTANLRDIEAARPGFSCACGAKTDGVCHDARDKCPVCNTFSTDHPYRDAGCDSDGDPILRCLDCDIRAWSHR